MEVKIEVVAIGPGELDHELEIIHAIRGVEQSRTCMAPGAVDAFAVDGMQTVLLHAVERTKLCPPQPGNLVHGEISAPDPVSVQLKQAVNIMVDVLVEIDALLGDTSLDEEGCNALIREALDRMPDLPDLPGLVAGDYEPLDHATAGEL